MSGSVLGLIEAGSESSWRAMCGEAPCMSLHFGPPGTPIAVQGGVHRPPAFVLAAEWRTIRACFAPFELVRPFVEYLLAERPARLVVDHLSGVSMELARLALALGVPVWVRLPEARCFAAVGAPALRWLSGLLRGADGLLQARDAADETSLRGLLPGLPASLPMPPAPTDQTEAPGFGYEAYALARRDHALLLTMQQPLLRYFARGSSVLDLGCGTGIFLEALHGPTHESLGVERNPTSARYARSLGHTVVEMDALEYLHSSTQRFDGVYCSHFVEHLPVAAAERLMQGVERVLRPGGVALFVFPDPESIRSQLLGFWRDPEHVRFYHPELVELIAAMAGLRLVESSLDRPGRRVLPFTMQPPARAPAAASRGGLWARLLRRLGIASAADLAAEARRADRLEFAVERLWAVNQTWAWEDNAVLCFQKAAAPSGGEG